MKTHRMLTAGALAFALAATASPAAAQESLREAARVARDAVRVARLEIERHVHAIADNAQAGQLTEKFSKTVPLANGGLLDLSNIAGDVRITGGAGDQVVIDATKRGRTAEELKEVTIEVTSAANRVEVRTRYPETRRNISVSVSFTVTVPKYAAVTVKSVSGGVHVEGFDGELHATSVSGNVTAAAAADLRSAKSVSGSVSVTRASSTADCAIKSISGDLTVKALKAREIQADTISGEVKLEDVTTARLTAKTISGDLVFAGPLATGGRYEFSAHSGNVNVHPADATGFELTAATFSGDIKCEMPLKVAGQPSTERRPRKTLHGTFGDGSAVLQINAFSGDITIVKKQAAPGK